MALILYGLTCQAQYPGYILLKQSEDFRKKFSESSIHTRSITADFKQEKTISLLSEKIHSEGKFWFQQKDHLRMEYTRPYVYLMILNAGKIYIRDAQKANTVSAASNKLYQQVNRILLDCVSGNMLNNTDFDARIFESGQHFLIELIPRAANLAGLYKSILIELDKKEYTADTINMLEISGDKTSIRLLNKNINAPISDSVFRIP